MLGTTLLPARRDAESCDAAWHAWDAAGARAEAQADAEAPLYEQEHRERKAAFLAAALSGDPDAQIECFCYRGEHLTTEYVQAIVSVGTDGRRLPDGNDSPEVIELLSIFDEGGNPSSLSPPARALLEQIAEGYATDYANAMEARGDFLAMLKDQWEPDYAND